KIWRFRYRFDNKSQQITQGENPAFSLAEARIWREKCRSLVAHVNNTSSESVYLNYLIIEPCAPDSINQVNGGQVVPGEKQVYL
ncbi:Arm DNA-binding domain-containing protein, partial [Salmonella enterica subsp. enterica serovar Anatum]|nr:Arm DNA-binding domain-containing protein [Salmonella enterica subsp. enterica serovar Anatum]